MSDNLLLIFLTGASTATIVAQDKNAPKIVSMRVEPEVIETLGEHTIQLFVEFIDD